MSFKIPAESDLWESRGMFTLVLITIIIMYEGKIPLPALLNYLAFSLLRLQSAQWSDS
jgi:hypothetical protein